MAIGPFIDAGRVDFIVADLERFTAGEIRALSTNIDANLRENPPGGTPVDLGWARANWIPSVGEPKILDSDKRDPSPADITARQRVAEQGLNSLLSYQLTDGTVFITNNVPYITALNRGHSTQSPPGFVQFAIEKAIRETYSAGASRAVRGRRADAARAGKARPKK